MKKRLLFVVDEREMGGVSVVLTDLIHFLDKEKFEIDLLVLHDKGMMLSDLGNDVRLLFGTSYFEAIDYTIGEVLKKGDLELIWKKFQIVFDLKTGNIERSIKRERKKILNKEYDVEIAFKDGFTALFTAYGNTSKKIHWLHCAYGTNNPNAKYENLFKKILPRFDRIVGVATNVVKEFNEIYHLEQKTEVIPVAMDSERIIAMGKKDKGKVVLSKENFNIAVVGRAHPVKGYERLLEVLRKLDQEKYLQNIQIHIFGDGPLFGVLCDKINKYDLQNKVFMEGATANPYAELKNFDILLLPSNSEAFGTVISEAFILGIPVLATRTSASEMSVKDNENGWICENNEEGLFYGLKNLIKNPENVEKVKMNLNNYHYDNDYILDRINALFE